MTAIDGWEVRKLTELAEYINGFAFKPDDWGKEGLPIIRIEQLKNPQAATDYYSGTLPEKYVINNGDLIFSWSASLFLRIWQHGNAALNQHLFKVEENEGINKVFLKLFIEFYLPELTKASHGSTMQHITRKELDKFSALFPINNEEQTQIATILSTIDKAIEQTEALIAKQQRIKAGLMQDLLTRGIDENGTIRSEATHAFKDSPLGRIPVEWEVGSILNYASRVRQPILTGPFGAQLGSKDFVDEGISLLRIGNVQAGYIDQTDLLFVSEQKANELGRYKIQAGDLLFARQGATTGRNSLAGTSEEGFLINYHIIRVAIDPKKCSPTFLYAAFNSDQIQSQVEKEKGKGTREGVNTATLTAFDLPVPSMDEQTRISNMIDAHSTQEEMIVEQAKKFRRLKSALMHDLLTGKVRVTELLL